MSYTRCEGRSLFGKMQGVEKSLSGRDVECLLANKRWIREYRSWLGMFYAGYPFGSNGGCNVYSNILL